MKKNDSAKYSINTTLPNQVNILNNFKRQEIQNKSDKIQIIESILETQMQPSTSRPKKGNTSKFVKDGIPMISKSSKELPNITFMNATKENDEKGNISSRKRHTRINSHMDFQ